MANPEFIFIRIGNVIQHIFQDIKPADFDHFLKLCEYIIINILWIIEPAKDEKINSVRKFVWNAIYVVLFYMKRLLSIRSSN